MEKFETGYYYITDVPFMIFLYKSDFSGLFCKINNNQKEMFIVLGEMNFPEGFSKIPAGSAYTASIAAGARRFSSFKSNTLYGLEKLTEDHYASLINEFRNTQTISGFEVFCVNENSKVWIAKSDFKHLKEMSTWVI